MPLHRADHAVHRAQGVCMANCMHCNYTAHLDVPAPDGSAAQHDTVKFNKAAKRVSLVSTSQYCWPLTACAGSG